VTAPGAASDCGCFAGIGLRTPRPLPNLPGLSAITYRVGTHGAFKASMLANLSILAQLPGQASPGALAELLTRQDGDFAIALLDAWATVADILTFYQERIANESYLRTATELRSVLQLAREIGYELSPGVAAGTVLAFTMDRTPGAPIATVIEAGTRVQSVPDPGQMPVTFETIAPIPARPAWNALRPSQTVPQTFDFNVTTVLLAGTATRLKPGDGLMVEVGTDPMFGIAGRVTPQPDPDPTRAGVTAVEFTMLTDGLTQQQNPGRWYRPADPTVGPVAQQLVDQVVSEDDLQATAARQGFTVADLFLDLAQGAPAPGQALAFRTKAAVFGHNAPPLASLPPALTHYQQVFSSNGRSTWHAGPYQGRDATWNGDDLLDYWQNRLNMAGGGLLLDASHPPITDGGSIVLRRIAAFSNEWGWYGVTHAADVSWADFTLSARVTRLTLDITDALFGFAIDATMVYAQSEWLPLAEVPDPSPVTGQTVMLDGWVEGLRAGQQVVVAGESADNPGARVVETPALLAVDHVLSRGGGTRLTLSPALQNRFVRGTVTINANAAPATHGETVQEIAGSGDAAQPFQTFRLRQPPLTYTAAATPSGGASTLSLWVDDVRWREVPSLIESGPRDHVYVVRLDENQAPTVEGGDGVTGARLPTGQENVRAVYRKGTGTAGLVRAGQLSLLSTRPLGVNGVSNPAPATGAQDPEALSDARANAPVSVLTLGRVVSLLDYQNFARAFGGVGKALAAWSHLGEARGVVVTVAGPGGRGIPADGPTCTHLLAALRAAAEPFVPVRVVPYRPATFQVALSIDVARDHDAAKVGAAAVAALRSAFAFERRDFGQAVAQSEVTAVVQATEGVVAVLVQQLYRTGDGPGPANGGPGWPANGVLTAAMPTAGGDFQALQGAELLTLDPAPVQVGTF
jgi:hypothetical protein